MLLSVLLEPVLSVDKLPLTFSPDFLMPTKLFLSMPSRAVATQVAT
jgi:hypothetical protein